MARHAKLLIVSGNEASPAKVPFFPEHSKEDFAADIARAPWLQVSTIPGQCCDKTPPLCATFRTTAPLPLGPMGSVSKNGFLPLLC